MDSVVYIKALLLGLLEGITEFLPISSTGHLIIAGDLLDFNDETSKVFKIVIQLGAILAVCWQYRAKLTHVVTGLTHDRSAQRFAMNLFIAFLPAAILGLAFHGMIKEYLFQSYTTALALIIGGIIILLLERKPRQPRVHSVDAMRWTDAFKVGCAQALALIPGTSRSGATIIGGLMIGLSRPAVTEFSFFLAIPTMFAASFYDLYKNWDLLQADDIGVFMIGLVAAFFSGLLAVRVLLRYIAHHSFVGFGWYRIVFGTVVLLYFW